MLSHALTMKKPAKHAIPRALMTAVLATAAMGSAPARAADPTTADCLSSSEASVALRSQHKLRAARAQLLVCATATCPADIRTECVRRVAEVNAAMPTIVFEAKDPAGNDASAVKVSVDGEPLVERLEGTALSIDPGEHTFTFETPGQPAIQKAFVIREGEKDRRERIAFGTPSPDAVPPPVTPALSTTMPATPVVVEPSHGLGTQRILAIVAGGLGVVGLGLGTVFGLQAMSKHNDAAAACPGACATQSGVDMWNDARSAGNVSTVAFIVGGVALAGGAALWFTAKPESGSAPSAPVAFGLGVGPGAVQVRGAW
jgi:hypothetical protein